MTEDSKIVGLEDTYLYFHDLFGTSLSLSVGQFRITDPDQARRDAADRSRNYTIFGVPGRSEQDQPRLRPGDHRRLRDEVRPGRRRRGGQRQRDRRPGDLRLGQVQELRLSELAQSFWKDKHPDRDPRLRGQGGGRGRTNEQRHVFRPGPAAAPAVRRVDPARYVRRTDSNPLFQAAGGNVATDAYLAEAVISPWGDKGRTFFTVAYNGVDSGLAEANDIAP